MIIGNHKRVMGYDGAFNCLDCKASWGALPDSGIQPDECNNREAKIKKLAEAWLANCTQRSGMNGSKCQICEIAKELLK